jgi:hypothetical protein
MSRVYYINAGGSLENGCWFLYIYNAEPHQRDADLLNGQGVCGVVLRRLRLPAKWGHTITIFITLVNNLIHVEPSMKTHDICS